MIVLLVAEKDLAGLEFLGLSGSEKKKALETVMCSVLFPDFVIMP